MDRRQQKSRNAIFEAFASLLSTKNYSRITIQNIIDKANVGRSTFYAHFETKDDLLRELCTDLFAHIFSDSLVTENNHDFSMKTGNPQAMITHILYHLLENKRNFLGILTCESGELFLGFFNQSLNELIDSYIMKDSDNVNALPNDFLVNHISSSFIGMVQWWLKNNLKQTPEELASYFMAVILPVFNR